MSKEVFEASPGPGFGGMEGPYITNAAPGVDGTAQPASIPRVASRPALTLVEPPPPDPSLGDPREVRPGEAVEAMKAQNTVAIAPGLPNNSGISQQAAEMAAPKGFLLYLPLSASLTGVVKIVGPADEIDSDHIDLLCEHLLLHKRLLEKREAKHRG